MKCGQSVYHQTFGAGHVTRIVGDTIYVDFGDSIKPIKKRFLTNSQFSAAWEKPTPKWVM